MKTKKDKSRWEIIERILIILTFLSVAITSYYSIRTATTALEQVSNELRPWISILGTDSSFQPDYMQIKVRIKNFGKIPAYVSINANAFKNGKAVKNTSELSKPALLMPNQSAINDVMVIKGESYKNILEGSIKPEIVLDIRVNYGLKKEDSEAFYVYRKVWLDYDRLHSYLSDPKKAVEFWIHVESDFR